MRGRFPDGNPEQTGEWLFGANAAMGGGDYIQAFIRDQSPLQWGDPTRVLVRVCAGFRLLIGSRLGSRLGLHPGLRP